MNNQLINKRQQLFYVKLLLAVSLPLMVGEIILSFFYYHHHLSLVTIIEVVVFYSLIVVSVLSLLAIIGDRYLRLTKFILYLYCLFGLANALILFFNGGYYGITGSVFSRAYLIYAISSLSYTHSYITQALSFDHVLILLAFMIYFVLLPGVVIYRKRFTPRVMPSTNIIWCLLPMTLIIATLMVFSQLSPRAATLALLSTQQLTTNASSDEPSAMVTSLVKQHQYQPMNLVFILLESTRYDATSMGSTLDTTPYLKSLAAQSVTADDFNAVMPHTAKALVAIFCGYSPYPYPYVIESFTPNPLPGPCLPSLLKPYGYHSAFFQANYSEFEHRTTLFKNLGFGSVFPPSYEIKSHDYEQLTQSRYEDEFMLPYSDAWLKKRQAAGGNFLATYLTVSTHYDYTPPKHLKLKHYVSDKHKNNYLNDQRYVDHYIQKLLAQYQKYHFLNNTIFIFLGDHGEGFGEHGLYTHDNVIYQEGLHIPFFIYAPGLHMKPQHLSGQYNQLDIVPTVIDLLHFTATPTAPGGISIFNPHQHHLLYSACFANPCVSIRDNDLKYIHYFDGRMAELYNLKQDPLEQHNLLPIYQKSVRATTVTKLRTAALAWRDRAMSLYRSTQMTTSG